MALRSGALDKPPEESGASPDYLLSKNFYRNINNVTGGFNLLFRLEAVTAVNRLVALRLEGDSSRLFAFRTLYFGGATRVPSAALDSHQDATVRATLGLVLQPLGSKEGLLTA